MTCTCTTAGFTVEIFVKQHKVAPLRVIAKTWILTMARPVAIRARQKKPREPFA
jgi:hypothetical protein